jgi:cell wall-associated NlpC family hydrolase
MTVRITRALIGALIAVASATVPAAAATPSTGGASYPAAGAKASQAPTTTTTPAATGGAAPAAITPATPTPTAPATLAGDGTAIAPAGAPAAVVAAIAAANKIATLPYRYGGGHRRWTDSGYDCSGSVSYALHAADLLDAPLTSGELADWGATGPGQWITVYANKDHTFMVIAGLRFDTSGQTKAGTRWQLMDRATSGFVTRHPDGL